MVTGTRQTAEVRREAVLEAALDEFAQHGLHGASTDAIARRAGISQPYLFRLFGSKKELYVATAERCLQQMLEAFREAASGKSGAEALTAIGAAYGDLIDGDRRILRSQLQAYAACDDPDIRAVVSRGFGRLVDYAEAVSGADPATLAQFFAFGMLCNVIAAMGLNESSEPWAKRLVSACQPEH
jgi:AcrR family transcriptional regulator